MFMGGQSAQDMATEIKQAGAAASTQQKTVHMN
jgi:hypothetical protein